MNQGLMKTVEGCGPKDSLARGIRLTHEGFGHSCKVDEQYKVVEPKDFRIRFRIEEK